MHELVIAQNIARGVEDEITTRKLKGSVETVHLRVGKLHAVVPDILTFNFDIVKKDIATLQNAVLEIHEIPIRATCPTCKKETILEEPFFLCIDCGGPLKMETGREMFVERISFNEEISNGN